MKEIVEVKLTPDSKLFVKYSDGIEGIIDLSDKSIKAENEAQPSTEDLNDVKINPENGDIIVGGRLELCKNATYEILKLRAQMKSFGINLDKS